MQLRICFHLQEYGVLFQHKQPPHCPIAFWTAVSELQQTPGEGLCFSAACAAVQQRYK